MDYLKAPTLRSHPLNDQNSLMTKRVYLAMLPQEVVVVEFQTFCKKYFMIIYVHWGCPK